MMSVYRRQYDDIFICQCPRLSHNTSLGPRITQKNIWKYQYWTTKIVEMGMTDEKSFSSDHFFVSTG